MKLLIRCMKDESDVSLTLLTELMIHQQVVGGEIHSWRYDVVKESSCLQ